MAMFFLNIRAGDMVVSDGQAYDFPTAQAARDVAVALLRETLDGHPEEFDDKQLEIADATGHPVAVVSRHDVVPAKLH